MKLSPQHNKINENDWKAKTKSKLATKYLIKGKTLWQSNDLSFPHFDCYGESQLYMQLNMHFHSLSPRRQQKKPQIFNFNPAREKQSISYGSCGVEKERSSIHQQEKRCKALRLIAFWYSRGSRKITECGVDEEIQFL